MTDTIQPQDEQAIIDRHVELLKSDSHEGVVNFPYLDSKGLITAGSGNNIERYIKENDKNRKQKAKDAFVKEPWYTKNGNRPASLREKENDFEKLWQKTESDKDFSNRSAKYYEGTTDLYLITKDVNNQVRKDAVRGRKDAKKVLHEKYFNQLTPEQQIVASDMALQLGEPKFQKFKKFRRAVIEQDTEEMVRQSLVKSSKEDSEVRRNNRRIEKNAKLILGKENEHKAHELIYEGISDFDKEHNPADYLKKIHRERTEKKLRQPTENTPPKPASAIEEIPPVPPRKPTPPIEQHGSLLFQNETRKNGLVADRGPSKPLSERELVFKTEKPRDIFDALGHSSVQKPKITLSQPIRPNAPVRGEDIVQILRG